MRYNIWFNQWFSSIYHTMLSVKESFDDSYIIASSRNVDHVYKSAADAFVIEPDIYHESYVQWALNICKKWDVNVVFVKRNALDMAMNKKRFEEMGVHLVVEDYDTLQMMQSKGEVYRKLEGHLSLPLYVIASNERELGTHLLHFIEQGGAAIMKADSDEGAVSVREVHMIARRTSLGERVSNREMSMGEVLNQYMESPRQRMMVMPVLGGPEVSVDCYLSKQGPVAIPRVKLSNRVQIISPDKKLIDMSIKAGEILGLKQLYNVQFMYQDGEPVLLEVNPRLSGGNQISAHSGIHTPTLVIKDLRNMKYTIPEIVRTRVSQVEWPVKVEGEGNG